MRPGSLYGTQSGRTIALMQCGICGEMDYLSAAFYGNSFLISNGYYDIIRLYV